MNSKRSIYESIELPSLKRLTDSQIRNIFTSIGASIFKASGRYPIFTSVENAIVFLLKYRNVHFYSKVLKDTFVIDAHTIEHLFLKERTEADYLRRVNLIASGLEIAEESLLISVIDAESDKEKGIIYYEILGLDERVPGKIIVVKLSEVLNNGKIFWTVIGMRGI